MTLPVYTIIKTSVDSKRCFKDGSLSTVQLISYVMLFVYDLDLIKCKFMMLRRHHDEFIPSGAFLANHHQVPGLLPTSAIMAFPSSLTLVLLVRRAFCALSSSAFATTNLFTKFLLFYSISSVYTPKKLQLPFLMVLCRDLLYPAISITSLFDLFSVHDMLIILQMCHISTASSLLSRYFVSLQHSNPCTRMDHNCVGFQSVSFGVDSDISLGEDGLS